MAEAPERCSFEFDPEAWEREHEGTCFVDLDRDEEILTENVDGDVVWRCPHESVDDEDACMFHLPRDSEVKPDTGTVADAFLEIVNGDREALDGNGSRPARFIGAAFESLDLDAERVGDGRAIDLRHTEVEGTEWNVKTADADPFDARGLSVRRTWICSDVTFGGEVLFEEAEFREYGRFERTRFCGPVQFGGTQFGGDARFEDSEFDGNADFDWVEFHGQSGFDGVQFRGETLFTGSKFYGGIRFNEAEFRETAWFNMAEFSGTGGFGWPATFRGIVFHEDARFDSVVFGISVRFHETEFNETAWFIGAEFAEDAEFEQAIFHGDTLFEKVLFHGATSFDRAEFAGPVLFNEARFDEGATFAIDGWYPVSQFRGDADFGDVTADGPLQFVDEYDSPPGQPYTFLGEVKFDGAEIQDAEFSGVSFREAPAFENANLTKADLSECPFEGATFDGADLTRANLSESDLSQATFDDALLTQTSLYGTDLTNAGLYGVRMEGAHVSDHTDFGIRDRPGRQRSSPLPFRGPWPDVYYDERNLDYDRFADDEDDEGNDAISDHTRAAAVYAEIERVTESNADSELASRCYLWRKDMQRKRYWSDEGRGNSRERFRWLRSMLANVFVRYGESPWRVTGIAGLVIVGCALLYYFLDLIEYSTSPSQSALLSAVGGTAPDPVVTFLDAVYFSTLTFSTLGMGTFQPSGSIGRAVAIFETLSGVVLLALLVFVFGRRATR